MSSKNEKKDSEKRPKAMPKKSQTDVIDRLDKSLFYEVDGGLHHSGPYDAAATKLHTNPKTGKRLTLAPIAAFHPSDLDPSMPPPPPSPSLSTHSQEDSDKERGRGGEISSRARKAMQMMEESDRQLLKDGNGYKELKSSSGGGSPLLKGDSTPEVPFHATANTSSSSLPHTSKSAVSLGFPASSSSSKKQKELQVMQAWGIRDQEAWEDYGKRDLGKGRKVGEGERISRYDMLSKEERAQRVASVWDMEATLREGKPIASGFPKLPPMPALPEGYDEVLTPSTNGENRARPKRSKSLIQRLRKGREKGSDSEIKDKSLANKEIEREREAWLNDGGKKDEVQAEPEYLHIINQSSNNQSSTLQIPTPSRSNSTPPENTESESQTITFSPSTNFAPRTAPSTPSALPSRSPLSNRPPPTAFNNSGIMNRTESIDPDDGWNVGAKSLGRQKFTSPSTPELGFASEQRLKRKPSLIQKVKEGLLGKKGVK